MLVGMLPLEVALVDIPLLVGNPLVLLEGILMLLVDTLLAGILLELLLHMLAGTLVLLVVVLHNLAREGILRRLQEQVLGDNQQVGSLQVERHILGDKLLEVGLQDIRLCDER